MDCLNSSNYNIYLANSVLDKVQGMLFRENRFDNSVLFIPSCNWVHSFFINSNLYLYFIDEDFKIVSEILLNPWKISPLVFNAKHVIESKFKLDNNLLNEFLLTIKNN